MKSQREAQQEIQQNKPSASVVEHRLDTSDIKERLRRYLKGITQKTVQKCPHCGNTHLRQHEDREAFVVCQSDTCGKTVHQSMIELENRMVVDKDNRRLNDKGVQSIMSTVNSFLDSSFGQGNTDVEHYRRLVADLNDSMKDDLFVNQEAYGLDDNDYKSIVEEVRRMAEIYLTRTINDLERKHLKNSMTVNESQSVEPQSKGFISRLIGG